MEDTGNHDYRISALEAWRFDMQTWRGAIDVKLEEIKSQGIANSNKLDTLLERRLQAQGAQNYRQQWWRFWAWLVPTAISCLAIYDIVVAHWHSMWRIFFG